MDRGVTLVLRKQVYLSDQLRSVTTLVSTFLFE